MSRSRRWPAALLTLLMAAAALAVPTPAYACSCVYPYDGPKSVARADVIFTARAIQTELRGDRRTFTFAVDRVYKGQARATETVVSHRDGATCGLEISGPGPFIVLAQRDADTAGLGRVDGLSADLCSGTRPGEQPVGLGEGYPPLPLTPDSAQPGSTRRTTQPGLLPGVVIGLALAATAGLVGGAIHRRSKLRDRSGRAKR